MWTGNRFVSGIFGLVGIIVAVALCFVILMNTASGKKLLANRPAGTLVWNSVRKQGMVTTTQFDNTFDHAKREKNNKLLKQLNGVKVVAKTNGQEYTTRVVEKDNKWSYVLTPVKHYGVPVINEKWLKEHN